MSRWSDFYQQRSTKQYRDYLANQYATFVSLIKDVQGKVVLEAGCGTGAISRILIESNQSNRYIVGDVCADMLAIASRSLPDVEAVLLDILNPLSIEADIIHSHGVLEHFSDAQIKQIVDNQLKITKNLVHYVPGAAHRTPSFGDERLMIASEWKAIANPTRIVEFNCGHDLALIWE
jgi:SAM-dependent methyltransferase